MVKKFYKKRIFSILLAGVMAFSLVSCGKEKEDEDDDWNDTSVESTEDYGNEDTPDDTETNSGGGEESKNKKQMQPPQKAPDGKAYSDWKGLDFTKEKTLQTKTFWGVHLASGRKAEDEGYTLDPKYIDGKFKILSAKVEPVGGEMKLRSGGYVDITIEAAFDCSLCYHQDLNNGKGDPDMLIWQEMYAVPFDMYTGTALLNYSDNDDTLDHELSVGQASDSGLIESDVTWNGRTYRLYAGMDEKNATFGGTNYKNEGNTRTGTLDTEALFTYKFRVPADYDGMALALIKDLTPLEKYYIDEYGNSVNEEDKYADILTDNSGAMHEAKDYYFVKVSDILEMYKNATETDATQP